MVSMDVVHHVYLLTNRLRQERSASAREQRIALYKSDQQVVVFNVLISFICKL